MKERMTMQDLEPKMVYDLDAMTSAIDQDPERSFELWCKEEMQTLWNI